MEKPIVCKFGGSSLADAACFRRVRDIIHRDQRRRYIVVSAPGRLAGGGAKITDILLAAAGASGDRRRRLLDDARSRFCRICMDLGTRPPYRQLAALEAYARMGRDALASRGEYICGLIMADFLDMPFIDAADIFAFENGAPDPGSTLENLRRLGSSAVIPGFYGSDCTGSIVTFSRGGSDISAAYVAAGVGAGLYENWTDVDGFHTADPAIVPDAAPIREMCSRQARLFARAGASVIHYESIAPAAEASVPILIKNTFSPDSPGTLIAPGLHCDAPCVGHCTADDGGELITASNLSCERLLALRDARPGGIEYAVSGGMLVGRCGADMLPGALRSLHAACVQASATPDNAPD